MFELFSVWWGEIYRWMCRKLGNRERGKGKNRIKHCIKNFNTAYEIYLDTSSDTSLLVYVIVCKLWDMRIVIAYQD